MAKTQTHYVCQNCGYSTPKWLGKCPECGRAVTEASEEAYFFKLSPFADRIEKLLLETDYLQPKSRAVELVNNFIKPGLEDLCVSRTSFTWGIPVTFDPGHVVYVWVDALSNYISALGWPDGEKYKTFWPGEHLVAKDILKPHAVFWPTMLKAAGLPVYQHLNVHGYWLIKDTKMSKSLGNGIDPMEIIEKYGEDALRSLATRPNAVGFLFRGMEKSALFPAILADGALPRKTFSMGHAHDKRFYIECRKIL